MLPSSSPSKITFPPDQPPLLAGPVMDRKQGAGGFVQSLLVTRACTRINPPSIWPFWGPERPGDRPNRAGGTFIGLGPWWARPFSTSTLFSTHQVQIHSLSSLRRSSVCEKCQTKSQIFVEIILKSESLPAFDIFFSCIVFFCNQ